MQYNISQCLGLEQDLINIKATTTEGLGFTGNGQGIASYAVCTIKKVNSIKV
jgi:2-C-methyl-D-erythritol 2,4-cyclodiphosphate synthase